MSVPCGPRWASGPSTSHVSQPPPGQRVSDSERSEVADRLAKHYADGRLDETEFSERLDRAMQAKTHADLNGLFADLPGSGQRPGETAQPAGQRGPTRRHPARRVLFLLLVVLVTVAVAQSLVWPHIPWLLIGLLIFLWLRFGPRHRGYRWPDAR